jgi:hypothetical protein
MTDESRLRRVLRLRKLWRKGGEQEPAEQRSVEDQEQHRRSDALDSNDRIRAEAPNDLETRRRADQLEREIKRPH